MNKLLSGFPVVLFLWCVTSVNFAIGAEYEEGVHYKVLPIPVQLLRTDDIEVVEIFHYRCGHCFRFFPKVDEWRKTLPKDVVFGRFPAAYRGDKLLFRLSKAYYTAKKLDKLDELHKLLFEAMLFRKPRLKSEQSISAIFGEVGINQEEFNLAFHADEITEIVERSVNLLEIVAITGTPAMVVNGKYLVSGTSAGGKNEMMFDVVEFLVEKERKALKLAGDD